MKPVKEAVMKPHHKMLSKIAKDDPSLLKVLSVMAPRERSRATVLALRQAMRSHL